MGIVANIIKRIPFSRQIYQHSFFLFYWREKMLMKIHHKSYAQDREDIEAERLLGSVRFFVDIGAHDGINGSNTFYFGLRGANGLCFEPVRETYDKLRSLYCFNGKIACHNCGISDTTRDSVIVALDFLSYVPETEDKEHTRLHQQWHSTRQDLRAVKLLRFEDATRGMNLPKVIDLLSIDVEGHELNVLRSLPFQLHHFRAIIVETHHRDDKGHYDWTHRDLQEIETLLAGHGYLPAFRTSINTIYTPQTAPHPEP